MLFRTVFFAIIILLGLSVFFFLDLEDNTAVSMPEEVVVTRPCAFDMKVRHMALGDAPLLKLEIAETREQLTCGLSHRESLPADAGLAFVFEEDDRHAIWMKDMNFPIDIIWLDTSWTVVDIAENISPDTFPQTFLPKAPARYVIELNAGSAELFNITIGDTVTRPREPEEEL